MAGIFVSYRRADSQGFAGRLSDDLIDVFGDEHVFRDIEIPIGSDFSEVLHQAIAHSDILLVVMGPHWARAEGYGPRLFEPGDWVRKEIESAFEQKKTVVPILVGEARMPASDSLPESIQPLVKLQAAALDDRHWDTQINQLTARLRQLSPRLTDRRPPTNAPRSTAEVIDQLGGKLIEGVLDQYRTRHHGKRHSQASVFNGALRSLRYLNKLFTVFTVLVVVYLGIHWFGDEATLRQLDQLETRVLGGLKDAMQQITR